MKLSWIAGGTAVGMAALMITAAPSIAGDEPSLDGQTLAVDTSAIAAACQAGAASYPFSVQGSVTGQRAGSYSASGTSSVAGDLQTTVLTATVSTGGASVVATLSGSTPKGPHGACAVLASGRSLSYRVLSSGETGTALASQTAPGVFAVRLTRTQAAPSPTPTPKPTPTAKPSPRPSASPDPSADPSGTPTAPGSPSPTGSASGTPTTDPTTDPSGTPTGGPTSGPTGEPSTAPSSPGRLKFSYQATRVGRVPTGSCSVSTVSGPSIKISCLDVAGYHQDGRTLRLSGPATINGQQTSYLILVVDNPGKKPDEFRIRTANGFSGGGTLEQGRVTINQQR